MPSRLSPRVIRGSCQRSTKNRHGSCGGRPDDSGTNAVISGRLQWLPGWPCAGSRFGAKSASAPVAKLDDTLGHGGNLVLVLMANLVLRGQRGSRGSRLHGVSSWRNVVRHYCTDMYVVMKEGLWGQQCPAIYQSLPSTSLCPLVSPGVSLCAPALAAAKRNPCKPGGLKIGFLRRRRRRISHD